MLVFFLNGGTQLILLIQKFFSNIPSTLLGENEILKSTPGLRIEHMCMLKNPCMYFCVHTIYTEHTGATVLS